MIVSEIMRQNSNHDTSWAHMDSFANISVSVIMLQFPMLPCRKEGHANAILIRTYAKLIYEKR